MIFMIMYSSGIPMMNNADIPPVSYSSSDDDDDDFFDAQVSHSFFFKLRIKIEYFKGRWNKIEFIPFVYETETLKLHCKTHKVPMQDLAYLYHN